jgi:hypothetical protein
MVAHPFHPCLVHQQQCGRVLCLGRLEMHMPARSVALPRASWGLTDPKGRYTFRVHSHGSQDGILAYLFQACEV